MKLYILDSFGFTEDMFCNNTVGMIILIMTNYKHIEFLISDHVRTEVGEGKYQNRLSSKNYIIGL